MLTETEVKGTKYFAVNKANLMWFFEGWGDGDSASNVTEIHTKL